MTNQPSPIMIVSKADDEPPPSSLAHRLLLEQDNEEEDEDLELWKVIYTCVVLLGMFVALIKDAMGADSAMLAALTLFLVAQLLSVPEALSGFANEGLLTVLLLFIVAQGISKTGALDWYMGKLLGRPTTTAGAQLKLMGPIAVVSAFLNNTPVVVVMIPIVQKWAKNIHVPVPQLLIPLSFASILGGTCTLIGTSTNLVVVGLLEERYANNPEMDVSIGLFDLGLYGVPVMLAGITYLLLASPFLLPGGTRRRGNPNDGSATTTTIIPMDNQEDILLGARLAPWSPAAGRSVKRSGLRDTGGIYLVSVHRSTTGNVHRAVGQDFVLNVGDVLYFTGMIEGFGDFCQDHGLEVLTNELQGAGGGEKNHNNATDPLGVVEATEGANPSDPITIGTLHSPTAAATTAAMGVPSRLVSTSLLPPVVEGVAEDSGEATNDGDMPVVVEVGVTMESLMNANEAERSRAVTRMIDMIRGVARDEPTEDENRVLPQTQGSLPTPRRRKRDAHLAAAHKVVVVSEHDFVVVGVDARDRPGLLLDISKGLSRLRLNLRHTEASVVGSRSLSIWRCELVDIADLPDLEEIWSVLNALLETESGSQAVKERGLRVMRAMITPTSSLIGKQPSEVDFRRAYKAGIVAIQKGGRNISSLAGFIFGPGDVLILQVGEDSPLLKVPPPEFYKRAETLSRPSSVASFVNLFAKSLTSSNSAKDLQFGRNRLNSKDGNTNEEHTHGAAIEEMESGGDNGAFFIGGGDDDDNDLSPKDGTNEIIEDMVSSMQDVNKEEAAWSDLQVIFQNEDQAVADGSGTREFLTAMEVAPKSKLAKRTVADTGLDKLPGVFLVSIDRPTGKYTQEDKKPRVMVITNPYSGSVQGDDRSEVTSLPTTMDQVFTTISPDLPLEEGDVLWFAGSASAVGDLRKIPGLISHESGEVEKINEKIHDRRLVEAVIARRGPLVGKTVKEARFRTRFGAAVIAVHRDGSRIHDHPGKIKLQAGDVLLLEAGPTFIKKSVDNDRSFALLAEVKDSAPPRLSLLIPALVITFAMLAVYTAEVASLLTCALVATILMVSLGILSEQEARDAVNWEVYVTIASAFGIGIALVNSGVAGAMANFLVDLGEAVGLGDAGLMGAVYFATFLISNVVTNNAAAALLFPIAMDAAEQTGVDLTLMSYSLMLGASASFMSPFGYTTNLLIYGPGGYKTKDFLTLGTPMQLVLWILSILFLATPSSNWWVNWVGTSLALGIVVIIRMYNPSTWFQRSSSNKEHSG